jgi:hypothetical protein
MMNKYAASMLMGMKNPAFTRQAAVLSALSSSRANQLVQQPQRGFRQVKNLHEIVWTAQAELTQRTAKYLERTDKVYKPSQTLEFNRDGELLIYSCDNIKNSTVYLKYPYVMYDAMIPLAYYLFFINPFSWSWQFLSVLFYGANAVGWLPHVLYWKHLEKKIHKLFLLRGGKYVRIWTQNPMGDRFYSWAHICEFNLLTENYEDFAEPVEDEKFLNKTGQLKYELQVQLDNYVDHAVMVQDETIYFMKEGTVHQPEVFEWVMKGYNIDTSDFSINTDHSVRFNEPNHNN